MSPASRSVGRLRELYSSVYHRMRKHEARLADPLAGRVHFQGIEQFEPRLLLSAAPTLPGLALVDPNLDNLRGQVIYIDADGEQDVTYKGPITVGAFDVPFFRTPEGLAGTEADILTVVENQLNALFADSGVRFTLVKPADDQPYSTIFIGGTDAAFNEYGTFLGLAEQVDISNRDNKDRAFVFSDSLHAEAEGHDEYISLLSTTTAHEAGRLLGYANVTENATGSDHLMDVAAAIAADITIGSISSVIAGSTVTIPFSVQNTGTTTRSFGVGGELWLDGSLKANLGNKTTSTLSPGSTYNGSFTYTTPANWTSGTYTARAAAWSETPGSSTWLDSYDRNFTVTAQVTNADITVSSISTVVAGDRVTVNYTVTNTGNYARSFGVGGEIWQGSTKKVNLGTAAAIAANGGTWTGAFAYTTPAEWGGSYFARCAVWDGVPGVGTQLDTTDRSFSVTPQPIPDITTGRIAWHSYTAYDDDGTGYRPLDGTIHVYDFGAVSHYTRAEATIAAGVVHAMNPNFSSDGRYITFMGLSASRAYSHVDDSWANWLDVYVYDFRTDTLTNLSLAAGRAGYGQVDEDPVFSPDGNSIVFKRDRSDLWVVDSNNYSLRQLTAGAGEESGPQFSPDGDWVVFWVGDGPNAYIAKVAASSTAATTYVTVINNDPVSFPGDTGVQDYFPSYWDDSRIIYTSWDTPKLPGQNDDDDIRIRDLASGTDYFASFNSGYPVDDSDAFGISGSLLGYSTRTSSWDLWYGDPVSGARRSLGIGLSSKHNLGGEYTQLVVPYVPNQAPTNIALSGSTVPENQPVGTVVGNLSTTDPDAGDTFVYSLVSGAGGTDNASFTISGNQLKIAASFNYEAKSSYSIRVRTTDQGGTGLIYEKVFTISVTDVDDTAPQISGWSSAATHGTVGELMLAVLDDGTFSEPRNTGVRRLVVQFSEPINPASFTVGSIQIAGLDIGGNDVDLLGIGISTSTRNGNTEGVIDFSQALPNAVKYAVRAQGVTDVAGNPLAGDNDRILTALKGDASGDRRVNSTDLSLIYANRVNPIAPGSAVQVACDVFVDGRVNSTDLSAAWANRVDARYIPNPVFATGMAAEESGMMILVAGSQEPVLTETVAAAEPTVEAPVSEPVVATQPLIQPVFVPAVTIDSTAKPFGFAAAAYAAVEPALPSTASVARNAKPELPAVAWQPAAIRLAPLMKAVPTAAAAGQAQRPVLIPATPVASAQKPASRLLLSLEEPFVDVLASVDRLLKL